MRLDYGEALARLAEARPDVVVMTAENRAPIRTLPARLGPRFIDVGICEQTLLGAAAGLALRGRTPVVHALAAFVTMRAFEFIRTDVGLAGLPVKIVGYLPGFLSEANGPTHQAIEDIALMRTIPGMRIVCPADEDELVAALPAILESRSPCYVRFIGGPAAVAHHEPFAFGKAERLRDGSDVAILSYGLLVGAGQQVAEILEARGVSVRLLNLRTLDPIDERALLASAEETSVLVTIEDHYLRGGLQTIVAEVMLRNRLTARVLGVGLEARTFRPALLADVLAQEGFTPVQIADRILRALALQPLSGERGLSCPTV